MKKKVFNEVHLSGYVYSHSLAVKMVANKASANYGKPFIGGRLDIATDDDCLNVVTVNFTYVTPTTKSGNTNATYSALNKIIEQDKTVVKCGKDNALKVNVDTALALNDFYSKQNGTETLVSAKRCEGGFVTIVDTLSEVRNHFKMDLLMNGFRRVEADPERHIDSDYAVISAAAFNFRGDILPTEFILRNPTGMNYFENLELSKKNKIFTVVEGSVISTTVSYETTQESAFGEPMVNKSTRNVREWLIEKSAKEPYEMGDPEIGITQEDIDKAIEARNLRLADVKKRQEEYEASKATPVAPAVNMAPVMGGGIQVPIGDFGF